MPASSAAGGGEPIVTRPANWRGDRIVDACPPWASWNGGLSERYTVGAEEEVMLLDPSDCSLAPSSDVVLARLSGPLADQAAPETHAAVVELATGIHTQTRGRCR